MRFKEQLRAFFLWADMQPDLSPEMRRKIEALREGLADYEEWTARYGDDGDE